MLESVCKFKIIIGLSPFVIPSTRQDSRCWQLLYALFDITNFWIFQTRWLGRRADMLFSHFTRSINSIFTTTGQAAKNLWKVATSRNVKITTWLALRERLATGLRHFYSHLLILWLHPESLSPYCDQPDPAILAYIPLTLVGGPMDFMYAWSDSKDLRYPRPNGLIHLNWMQLEDLYPKKFLRRRSGSAGSILTLSKIWLKDSVYHLRLLFIIIALSHEPNEGFLFCLNKRIGFLQFTHLFVKSPQLANHTGCPILEILQHLFDIQPMWQV